MAAHPVDHGNGQTLDNRTANLAWVSKAANRANQRPRGTAPTLDAIVLQLIEQLGARPLQEIPF